ncbi:diguanylate cyclase [Roseibium aggregatum]|uniref:diguanylate cyclase n=1 Tax=Roseibium aggregatum TaxID=187304 RepID=UPI001AD8E7C3|nr:diguanylate cyclase [Roseibium aggregatum]
MLVAFAVAAACFLTGIAVTAHIGALVQREHVLQHKRQATASLSEARARLEGEFNRTVAHGVGIKAYVAQFDKQAFEAAEFREIAIDLLEENPAIRSIGLAPDNVVRAVFPSEPNKAALGLDYRTNALQWPAVNEAMQSRQVVIAGPTALVQGGRALMIRIPVFPAAYPGQSVDERSYWGTATLILDIEAVMASAGIENSVNGTLISIIDKTAHESGNTVVFGNQNFQGKDYVSVPLNLPGGLNWEVLGYPQAGWENSSDNVLITRVVGFAISLIFGALTFLLISEVYKVRSMALHDPLTGLANRRLLEERMQQMAVQCNRSGAGFEIFYVDLDAFKPVNDNFGHGVGDKLLIEVGQRLLNEVRQSDTVARVGGDEFIVLTPGNMRRQEKEGFQKRLSDKVSKAFECAGARINVKASFGSASYPGDASTVDDLLRIADGRMYAHKARSKKNPRDIPEKGLPQAG